MRSLAILAVLAVLAVVPAYSQKKLVCYYSSWAVYRPGEGKFDVENIDPFLCTHVIYSFLGLDRNGSVFSLDPWNDIDNGGFARFNALRNINVNLKTMLAIGGWNANSSIFSDIVTDPIIRQTFVTNLYDYVKLYDFNGLDFDWEYPAQRGGRKQDKENYVFLLQELRAKFGPEGLLLSAGVHANPKALEISYNVPEMVNNLDFINLMTYDYHGFWDNITGINSPLYQSSLEIDIGFNVNATVQLWLQYGAPADKLIVGIPTYGRSFTVMDESNTGIGEPTIGAGDAGEFSREPGNLSYLEICMRLGQGVWAEQWDEEQQAPYMYQADQWVSFDNTVSVGLKAEYGRNNLLGGSMVWAIDSDDFFGKCGQGSYPLIKAIKSNTGL